MSSVTASIDQVGASPINIQWKVVRGDSATLKVEFLEDDEVTFVDISDWAFVSSSYDASGDTLDELTVEKYSLNIFDFCPRMALWANKSPSGHLGFSIQSSC